MWRFKVLFHRFFLQSHLINWYYKGLCVANLFNTHRTMMEALLFAKRVYFDFAFCAQLPILFVSPWSNDCISTTKLVLKSWHKYFGVFLSSTLRKRDVLRHEGAYFGHGCRRSYFKFILRILKACKTWCEIRHALVVEGWTRAAVLVARFWWESRLLSNFNRCRLSTSIDNGVRFGIWDVSSRPWFMIINLWFGESKFVYFCYSLVFPEFGNWRFFVLFFNVLYIRSWKTWTFASGKIFWVFSAHLVWMKRDIFLGHEVRISFLIINQLVFTWRLSNWVGWCI